MNTIASLTLTGLFMVMGTLLVWAVDIAIFRGKTAKEYFIKHEVQLLTLNIILACVTIYLYAH